MGQQPFQWVEPTPPPSPNRAKDSVAAAVRGGSVSAIPTLLRVGSGLASGLTSSTGIGMAAGGAISGAGETLAEMIENGSMDPSKLNKGRIALEAALGAIPGAKLVREGQVLKSVLLGGGAAALGVAGRKLTADNPEERQIHPASDLFNIALGAGVGGVIGRFSAPKEVKIPDNWDIQTTAVPGGRVLGSEKGKLAEVNTVPSIAKEPATPPLTPPPAPAEGSGTPPYSPPAPTPYRSAAKAADRVEAQGWQQEGKNLNARDKYLNGVANATDKESLQIEQQRMKDWQQEAKNLNARDAYEEAKLRSDAVDARLKALEKQGATSSTVVTESAKQETPTGTKTATTITKLPPPEKVSSAGGGKGKAPTSPIAPKDGVFQIVQKNGKIVEATDEATALALANAGGPGTTVVPPPASAVEPIAGVPVATPAEAAVSKAPRPKKLKGTATEVAAKLPMTPPEPPAAAGAVPIPTLPKTTPPVTGAAVAPPVGPSEAAGGLRLSAPLAMRVAAAQQDVPAGSAIARFFLNKGAALKAGAYNEELPEGTIGALTPLMGQAETSKALGKAENNPQLSEAGGTMWDLLRKVGKELNLPQMPRGSSAKPSFKLAKTPAGEPFVPSVPETVVPPGAPAAAPPTAGLPVAPAKPISTIEPGAPPEPSEFPPIETGKPLPPLLQARIKTAQDQMQVLQNSGRGTGPEADKLAAEIEGLQREAFAAQYPGWMPEEAPGAAPTKTRASRKPKGTTLGAGLGGAQDIMDLIRSNPQFALRAGLTGGGAAIGASQDQDNPVQGAVLGGAAGYGAARGLERIGGSAKPLVNWDPEQPGNSLARNLSSFQRFNFLSDPLGLGINTVAAPFGAGMMGSLERALVGRAEGSPEKVQQGMAGMHELLKSYGSEAGTRVPTAWQEAAGYIGRAEEHDQNQQPLSKLGSVFAGPGKIMTTGDVLSRDALLRAGIPEDVARGITVTSNPRYKGVGEPIVNFAKSSPVAQLLLPFSRTSANILEGSLERTPLVGFMLQKTNDPNVKATMAEVLTRQGMGGATWYAAYELGKHADPNVTKDYKLNTLVSNMAGQYGLLAAAGFAAGQAQQLGKIETPSVQHPSTWGGAMSEGAKQFIFGTPLPSTRPLEDIVQAAKQWPQGQPIHPDAQGWIRQHIPASFTPGVATATTDYLRKNKQDLPFRWEE